MVPTTAKFRNLVWQHYHTYGRNLPWRNQITPYRVLVSELMLQQTQVDRVIPKYKAFLRAFPNFKQLAQSPLSDVLKHWQGLGYNRRAKFLQQTAIQVTENYRGKMPTEESILRQLPGIGCYTARALQAFAFNQPVVIVETNIRTVYLHHFFRSKNGVSDQQLVPHIAATLDSKRPREWYWALMDYGTALKRAGITAHRKSKTYYKQSRFQGSNRQVRGRIIRYLAKQGPTTRRTLVNEIDSNGFDTSAVIEVLIAEQLVARLGARLALPDSV